MDCNPLLDPDEPGYEIIDQSAPAPALNGRANSLPGAPSRPHRSSSASPSVNLSRGRGLQLGGNKASSSVLAAQLAEEVANEAGKGTNHSWNDDLIDINADEGDWSAFESAPAMVEPKLVSPNNGLGFGISVPFKFSTT